MTKETSNLLILEKSTKKDESKSESRKNFWRHCIPWRCNSDYALLDSSIGVFKKLLERRQYCRHFLVKLKDAVGNSCENIVKNGTV